MKKKQLLFAAGLGLAVRMNAQTNTFPMICKPICVSIEDMLSEFLQKVEEVTLYTKEQDKAKAEFKKKRGAGC
jgi:hypothetical protein